MLCSNLENLYLFHEKVVKLLALGYDKQALRNKYIHIIYDSNFKDTKSYSP